MILQHSNTYRGTDACPGFFSSDYIYNMLCEGRGGRNIFFRGRKSILPSLSAPRAEETRGGRKPYNI